MTWQPKNISSRYISNYKTVFDTHVIKLIFEVMSHFDPCLSHSAAGSQQEQFLLDMRAFTEHCLAGWANLTSIHLRLLRAEVLCPLIFGLWNLASFLFHLLLPDIL